MTLDKLFLAFHVFGAFLWIGGLFATIAFIETTIAEPDAGAKARLVKATRTAAIVPDVGAAIAIVFGAHWLMRFKLYEAHYMQPKLGLVVLVVGIHWYLKTKVGALKRNETVTAPPMALKPIMSITVLSIIFFVITKWPA